MPGARDGSARGLPEGRARLLVIRYADQAEALPIDYVLGAAARRPMSPLSLCAAASSGRPVPAFHEHPYERMFALGGVAVQRCRLRAGHRRRAAPGRALARAWDVSTAYPTVNSMSSSTSQARHQRLILGPHEVRFLIALRGAVPSRVGASPFKDVRLYLADRSQSDHRAIQSGAIIRAFCVDGPRQGLRYLNHDSAHVVFSDVTDGDWCIYKISSETIDTIDGPPRPPTSTATTGHTRPAAH